MVQSISQKYQPFFLEYFPSRFPSSGHFHQPHMIPFSFFVNLFQRFSKQFSFVATHRTLLPSCLLSFIVGAFFLTSLSPSLLAATSPKQPDAQFIIPKKMPKKLHREDTEEEEQQPNSDIDLTGGFVRAFKSKNPLKRINPFAPASEGYGEVSHNLNEIGKNEGIILFGIRW